MTLTVEVTEEEVLVCPYEAYRDERIKLRCSQEAVSLDLESRHVVLGHKEVVPYDGLMLAVGGRPFVPGRIVPFGDAVFTLKTMEDARAWIARLEKVESVLLVGGDLTSFSVAKALIHLGRKVHFLLDDEAFWPLRADAKLLAAVADSLAGKGVDVISDGELKGIVAASVM